jgi:putative phosphoesterase
MRVAAIYDIHGNLPALEAVLEEVRQADVDAVVVGGDVFPGPMPRETLARLMNIEMPVHFIRGNGDREVLALMRGEETSTLPEQVREALRWVAQQLKREDERLLAEWQLTKLLQVDGLGEVLFCHATPRNDTEIFTRTTPEEALPRVFEGIHAQVVICGHTHMQFDRRVGALRVVNAGSVGMPFGEAGAYWLLLGPEVQFRHTSYDLRRAAERIRNTEYPQAEDFAAGNVLRPPPEAEMLAVCSKAEIR